MVIVQRTTLTKNISDSNGTLELHAFGTRGGILLSLFLRWVPYSYWNKGLSSESAKYGDVHVLLIDSGTGRSPLGQADVTIPDVDAIVVPSGGVYRWEHPERGILENIDVVGRLAINTSFNPDPLGFIRQHLILQMFPDPARSPTVAHSIAAESVFLSFDTAVT